MSQAVRLLGQRGLERARDKQLHHHDALGPHEEGGHLRVWQHHEGGGVHPLVQRHVCCPFAVLYAREGRRHSALDSG
jgi:hypothetical protein